MDEIIKSVTDAEQRAAQMKSDAVVRAGQIIEEARAQAAAIEAKSASERAAFRESSLKAAEEQAEKDYAAAVAKSRAEAQRYADHIIGNTDAVVGKIVGRINGGNC